jgi:hypothetical protein
VDEFHWVELLVGVALDDECPVQSALQGNPSEPIRALSHSPGALQVQQDAARVSQLSKMGLVGGGGVCGVRLGCFVGKDGGWGISEVRYSRRDHQRAGGVIEVMVPSLHRCCWC